MYNLIKPIFFKYDPEVIHHKVFNWIKTVNKIPGVSSVIRGVYCLEDKKLEREVFGIKFKNPVGLAAGFDKDAKLYEELKNFGFGFIEVGTITPVGQPGNDKPRMFRLVEDEALINRMGFNNEGVDEMVIRLKNRKNSSLIIGGNIGKNKVTPNEEADEDFVKCFEKLFDYVDYFVVNVSSPNTPGLRDLQDKEPLKKLLFRLQQLNQAKVKSKPILLKIAPDLTNEQLDDIIEIVQDTKIAGVIATNTTISRNGLRSNPELVKQMGGLSGIPVKDRSTEVIRYLSQKSNKSFPIVGVGGIHSGDDAIEKLKAGASLVQIYTGFIYKGPGLVKEINQKILEEGI
ncbi:quinone-dependent dihydroorotate dehydrogenase [Solitalea sp. MAHUQ-68]|uniref:Dihydroorotate dehydrogenase (quinone) n=1 Tax=Solitalea agri TaxID=2953739 RepID=A0A9X2EZM3_9SPHI|nr:quinone-dependent dihydroorotate dehydrogenase [Solitalea agri]MCO4291501.1 quinone-dependent dihydroorotate dehydrogenase [Solitalea agri]